MRENVMVRVMLVAVRQEFGLRMPWALSVDEALRCAASLLHRKVGERFDARSAQRLMLLDGEHAGLVLDGSSRVGELVRAEILRDGTRLALV